MLVEVAEFGRSEERLAKCGERLDLGLAVRSDEETEEGL